ncbi:hypothetical protein E2C01_075252 [Portunus trituberculatus]|uniref:Uncharacterized protein n=1 Tax=Portunus trituberculatus TaxID=210409 RepID=A0A5B7IFC7_PORTR|nr:hypothetical protein [Portunus trituberculatus]
MNELIEDHVMSSGRKRLRSSSAWWKVSQADHKHPASQPARHRTPRKVLYWVGGSRGVETTRQERGGRSSEKEEEEEEKRNEEI